MPESINRAVLLKSRPLGAPTADNFELVESPVPAPKEGEVLIRTIYLSLDPYMRGRMSEAAPHSGSFRLGEVIGGRTVGQVVESRNPSFHPGDFVLGGNGWQAYGISGGKDLRKLDPSQAPISYSLGVLGMPGMTGYVSLLEIGRPKAGETVVVSAAAGGVGSVAGQVAKIKGCMVVGVAGTDEKCEYVTRVLGLDACVNHRTPDLTAALQAVCPNGIDVYVDNVGGRVLEAVFPLLNLFARVPMVGSISQYNALTPPPGPNLRPVGPKRITLQGFLVSDHAHRQAEFLAEVGGWLKDGKIKYREDVVQGLENAPAAFAGLLEGKNFGKLVVQVGPDPTKG